MLAHGAAALWVCECGFRNRDSNVVCGGFGKLGCKKPRPQSQQEDLTQHPGLSLQADVVLTETPVSPALDVSPPDDLELKLLSLLQRESRSCSRLWMRQTRQTPRFLETPQCNRSPPKVHRRCWNGRANVDSGIVHPTLFVGALDVWVAACRGREAFKQPARAPARALPRIPRSFKSLQWFTRKPGLPRSRRKSSLARDRRPLRLPMEPGSAPVVGGGIRPATMCAVVLGAWGAKLRGVDVQRSPT